MTATQRPDAVRTGPHTKDDGLFGPDSVTWRVHSDPTMLLTGTAAATAQMLHPRVMRMIDQASTFRTHPELRARRTGEFILTITYGDVETAEKAADVLHRIHTMVKATDPETGEEYNALVPELLLWVHNTVIWSAVRGFDTYGPELTPEERDRYIVEQHETARLLRVNVADVPSTWADLDQYVTDQLPHLAFTHEAVWFRDLVVPKGIPFGPEAVAKSVLDRAAIGLMKPEHRELYGIQWASWTDTAVRLAADALLKGLRSNMPVDKVIPNVREQVDVNAFGQHGQHRPTPTTDTAGTEVEAGTAPPTRAHPPDPRRRQATGNVAYRPLSR